MDKNLRAFLALIAHTEGTDRFGKQNGYNVLVGGGLFDSYADHPNILVKLPKYKISSTAAGRYQILYRFWKHYKALLKLKDFSPMSQDAVAVQLIKEQKAYADVLAGNIAEAIEKCANIWASFPGAGYGQREHKLKDMLSFYTQMGGTLNEASKQLAETA